MAVSYRQSANIKKESEERKMKGIFCNRIYLDNESYDENGNIIKHLVKGGNRNRIIIYPVLNGTEKEWERLKI